MTDKKENNSLGWKMWAGIGASFLYAAVAVFFLWHNQKYSEHLKLSEVGDYLAGVFSPLAFLWLVIGYLMQNRELKNQLKEFEKNVQISNSNLAFNKINQEKKDIFDHNVSQPVFEFEVKADFSDAYYFKIINHASSATEISFFLTNDIFEIPYLEPGETVIYLGNGEEKEFRIDSLSVALSEIKFSGMEKNEFIEVKKILITYYDTYQIHQTIKARLIIENNKKYDTLWPTIEVESTRKSLPAKFSI